LKIRNIITSFALADLLCTAFTLSARCVLAQATQIPVLDSTEVQSETEQSVGTEIQSAPKTIASTACADRLPTAQAKKVTLVSKRSPGSSFIEVVERERTDPQTAPQANTDAQELAKKLANPVASLISVPLQSNFDFRMGTASGWRYTLNVQPVIPVALSSTWNMISRTIIPIIHQSNVTGPNTSQSGLGDTVQSLFFSPNKTEPFIWAIGPVALIPTGTNANLGAQKWGLGPDHTGAEAKERMDRGLSRESHLVCRGKSESRRRECDLRSALCVIQHDRRVDLRLKYGIHFRLE
jgi:hypothetical protein